MGWLAGLILATRGAAGAAGAVVVNELMYHAASHEAREDYLELFNLGPGFEDLGGWQIGGGISYLFPEGTVVPPGEFLVMAADPGRFRQVHPEVANVAGPYAGRLSNTGEELVLRDARGREVDRLRFAQDGEWAARIRGPEDYGHRGLVWSATHDGGGASLELIQPRLPNEVGQNWAASLGANGTPGRSNSVAAAEVAPLILDVRHYPAVPRSADSVTVRATVLDEQSVAEVRLFHRLDGEPGFAETRMVDDGTGGDGHAGDGEYGAVLPARPDRAVVEFYLEARDAGGRVRTWPAPVLDDGAPRQSANALYEVSDEAYAGRQPLVRLVLKAEDRAELEQINRNRPAAPYPTSDQTRSHAQFNATWVVVTEGRPEVRYGVGVRNRGNGSRSARPQSYRVNFAADRRWRGVTAVNLNPQFPDLQLLGSVLFREAGVAAALSEAVQLRVNGVNQAFPELPSLGFCVLNEVIDADFANRQFPTDAGGNIYRAQRRDSPLLHANLEYLGDDPDAYRPIYFKRTNGAEDDWSDLMGLARVLTRTPEPGYLEEVGRVADVSQWVRYFAINTLLNNRETSPVNGHGDDYFLFRGLRDPRFQLLPYDLDTILGAGNSTGSPQDPLFLMLDDQVPNFVRLLTHPEVAPLFFRELRRLAAGALSPAAFDPVADRVLRGLTPEPRLRLMKEYMAARSRHVLATIPDRLSVTSSVPVVEGLPTTDSETVAVRGHADPTVTRTVLVNGVVSDWSAWQASWTNAAVTLVPGWNRLLVQAMDEHGSEVARESYDLLRSSAGGIQPVSGSLTGDLRWATGSGPYRLSGTVTVPPGATLIVDPGVTVFAEAGSRLVVRGRLAAEGRPEARIRFTREPGVSGETNSWAGLVFEGRQGTNRLVCVDFVHAGSGGRSLEVTDAILELDRCTFAGTTRTLIETRRSSLDIRGCTFPSLVGNELIHGADIPEGGFLRIEGNVFGTTTGLNDIIDFSRARRPGPILEVRNNLFTGASDDVLDLDGCDAHIEGNVFTRVSNGDPAAPDTSSAISFGEDGGYGPHVVAVRNWFFQVDHVALCKEGGFLTLEHNTGVGIGIAAVNFGEPLRGVLPGRGARLEGNLFWNCPANFENRFPTNGEVQVVARRNLSSAPFAAGDGSDNLEADPLFVNSGLDDLEGWGIPAALALRTGSPASQAGIAGLDLGAGVPPGLALKNEPPPRTWMNSATFEVGGPGRSEFRWRLDEGPWSEPSALSGPPLSFDGLAPGTHLLEVLGRDSSGRWDDVASAARWVWTVDSGAAGVKLSELLTLPADGESAFAELWNDGPMPVDLSGWSLALGETSPPQVIVPDGTTLAAGARWITGFSSHPAGGTIVLRSADGLERDRLSHGFQISGASLARRTDGEWDLADPTPAAPNRWRAAADGRAVLLNEWLAAGRWRVSDDFVEIHNPWPVPARLDGLGLTDNAIAGSRAQPIASLSFLGPGAVLALVADGTTAPGHLDFRLASEQGSIALVDHEGSVLDEVFYGPQRVDVSEGRSPSGGALIRAFDPPTPGALNPGVETPSNGVEERRVALVPFDAGWRYDDSGVEPPDGWMANEFDDGSWKVGNGLLAHDSAGVRLPAPANTELDLRSPSQTAFYFRTRFVYEGPTNGVQLALSHILDDGAVIYLNGEEVLRFNLPTGQVTHGSLAGRRIDTAVLEGPVEVPTSGLRSGENRLAAEVHQSSVSSADVVFGARLEVVQRITNQIESTPGLRLSELLARPAEGAGGAWLEIHNPGSIPLDASGIGITDDLREPYRFAFPAGTTVAAGGTLLVGLGSDTGVAAWAAPIPPPAEGGTIYLFQSRKAGGALLDSVFLGFQVPGYSIGRLTDLGDAWGLAMPTPGASMSTAVPLGRVDGVRLNEWMAAPAQGSDWLELLNPGSAPVRLDGLRLTDDPVDPGKFVFPPLSFLGTGAHSYLVLRADEPARLPDRVGFRLAREGDSIWLATAQGTVVDQVAFGPQSPGVSAGRWPDGAPAIQPFPGSPTPGGPNQRVAPGDADGDGLPDEWEVRYGLRPDLATGRDGPSGDADGDGRTNFDEYVADTHPVDADSQFRVLLTREADGFWVAFFQPAGRRAELEVNDTLDPEGWRPWRARPAPTVRSEVRERVDGGSDGARFYRARLILTPGP